MKFAVLALFGLVTVTQANQLPLTDAVSLYEDVEEDLTDMIKITVSRKNADNIARASEPLGDAAAKVGMKCSKDFQTYSHFVARSKEVHRLVNYADKLDPSNNVQVRKDLMAIDEQMLRVAAEGVKSYRRGTESADFEDVYRELGQGKDVWMQHQNEDFAALDRELGQEIKVELALMQKPWAKELNNRIEAVFKSESFGKLERRMIKCHASPEGKALRAEWKKYMTIVGQNVKVTEVPADIKNYNVVHGFERFMSVVDSLLHGRHAAAYHKKVAAMKVYTSHKDDDDK